MGAPSQTDEQASEPFVHDDDRWLAVVNRDPAADGLFYYSVKTTGVYCRAVCPARLALRRNVRFHATRAQAEAAGFRPCKRCQPENGSLAERHAAVVAQACRLIESAGESPSLDELSGAVGVSRYHLHRLFRSQTGITPKAYAASVRTERVRNELTRTRTIAEAIYGAGFSSSGRFYDSSARLLGMSPTTFRAGGTGTAIRFATGECWLGSTLVAASDQGVCAIFLGDDADQLVRDLSARFPNAELIVGDEQFEQLVSRVIGFVANPGLGLDLPLDIRGTAFQQRVWSALCEVPAGATATYAGIARRIGEPKSTRAVARACGANALAVAIPCHRVVRSDGSLAGYRWGVDRKRELLEREQEAR